MEGMSSGRVASDWYCALYSNPPCNRRPRHTHTQRPLKNQRDGKGVGLLMTAEGGMLERGCAGVGACGKISSHCLGDDWDNKKII